jgi:hypothetical protein
MGGDKIGAALILAGAAAIIGLILRGAAETDEVEKQTPARAKKTWRARAFKSQLLQARLQTEYATARSVGPSTDRHLTVWRRNRHRFIEWHQLTIDHPAAAGR